MPELPEVETTKNGISPHIVGNTVNKATIRRFDLRWPIPRRLASTLKSQTLHSIQRRAKYLLLGFDTGTLIMHLGMSGKLFITTPSTTIATHDHVDISFSNNNILRFNDARRFGSIHWTTAPTEAHFLLSKLGPEPLEDDFDGKRLFDTSRGKTVAVKNFVMNNHVVVGVGNIYANEALFRTGLRPTKAAGKITAKQCDLLSSHIKDVLQEAIACGGTTLKDYANGENKPGYFKVNLAVYGRAGEPCLTCGNPIEKITLGQRGTFYCKKCQR